MAKMMLFLNFNHELWAISRSCQNSVIAVEKLHMQGCMMGHSAGLPTLVAMKYGGSNMADKWQKLFFF